MLDGPRRSLASVGQAPVGASTRRRSSGARHREPASRISSIRRADSFESGISARSSASTSLHSMPRGPDPRGASTVLVNLAPEVITMVTEPPQLQHYFT